jgi:hypothetical protein
MFAGALTSNRRQSDGFEKVRNSLRSEAAGELASSPNRLGVNPLHTAVAFVHWTAPVHLFIAWMKKRFA